MDMCIISMPQHARPNVRQCREPLRAHAERASIDVLDEAVSFAQDLGGEVSTKRIQRPLYFRLGQEEGRFVSWGVETPAWMRTKLSVDAYQSYRAEKQELATSNMEQLIAVLCELGLMRSVNHDHRNEVLLSSGGSRIESTAVERKLFRTSSFE